MVLNKIFCYKYKMNMEPVTNPTLLLVFWWAGSLFLLGMIFFCAKQFFCACFFRHSLTVLAEVTKLDNYFIALCSKAY